MTAGSSTGWPPTCWPSRATAGWSGSRATTRTTRPTGTSGSARRPTPRIASATSRSRAASRCDVSPKGDAAGFVLVLDDRHLVVPDRPGNNRIDGLTNIMENPHVGMIFLIPGREDTLRVNGRAYIVRDREILDRLEVQGKRPKVAIGVEVEECFLHCAKAFKRSGLWERERWPDVAGLPSMARMLWDQIDAKPAGLSCVEDYERDQQERLRKTLY